MSVIDFPEAGERIGTALKPKRYDIEIYQGDTFAFDLSFFDASNAAIDITGWTALAQIKNLTDGTPAATPAFTTTVDAVAGTITVALTPEGTDALPGGEYKYDVQISDGTNKRTYIGGKITVTEDISE